MYLNDLKTIFTSIRSFSLYIYLTDKTVSVVTVVTLFTLAQMIAALTLYSVNLFYSLRYKYIFRKCNCNKANANTCCWLKLRRQSGAALPLLCCCIFPTDSGCSQAGASTRRGIYCLYKILLIASITSLVRQINTSGCKDVVRKTNVTINVYKIFACSSFSVQT